MAFGIALLVLVVLFFVVYTAVRMAVSDALRNTLREEFLLPASPARLPKHFQLDAGDEADA